MQYQRSIKDNIKKLIDLGMLIEASDLSCQYQNMVSDDIEIYSMQAIIAILENRLPDAEAILQQGLRVDNNNFDAIYNLAYIYEAQGKKQKAYELYLKLSNTENIGEYRDLILEALQRLQEFVVVKSAEVVYKKKIVFFVKQGLDSFLGDIIHALSDDYEIKKIIVTQLSQIDQGMQWADICWFEWCDELVVYGSGNIMAKEKCIICRLHRYEAFTDLPKQVTWKNVNVLVVVTDHLKTLLTSAIPNIDRQTKIVTIQNGVDLNQYAMIDRQKGFKLAYVGYIHSRKNPILLLQIIYEMVKIDKRYTLFIAGQFQEPLIELYWNYQIKKMGLEKNIKFEGWQKDVCKWLKDKNYILSSSIHESFGYGIAEAMAVGIKPVIHDFVFAEEIWAKEFLFNGIDEAVEMISSDQYSSAEYRNFIKSNYSLDKQLVGIKQVLDSMNVVQQGAQNTKKNDVDELIAKQLHFNAYDKEYINRYNFHDCKIQIGRIERLSDQRQIIEFIINNRTNEKIVLQTILYDVGKQKIILPEYILYSKNKKVVQNLVRQVLNYKLEFHNNIAGFINDQELMNDIKKNELAYAWERGIPASHFMPAMGYLKVIERYVFGARFVKKNDYVLEAACGFGYGAAYLSKRCNQIIALDLAQDNIEFGKQAYGFDNIKWVNGDVTKLPFEDNTFNVYTSFETFEHLPLDLIDQYLQEAIRVLKKDGIMILSTPNYEMRKHVNNPFHIKEYTFSEWDLILKKYFKNVMHYSVVDSEVEEGIKGNAMNMVAVCSNDESDSSEKKMLMNFLHNSDDMNNTEKLFDYFLDMNKKKEYMYYLSQWFIRSKFDLTSRMNYYYGNMYRKFSADGYDRFQYLNFEAYESMENIGKEILELNYSQYFNKIANKKQKRQKILFILNGLDIKQSVHQFFANYLKKIENSQYDYCVLSLLTENEFANSQESIMYFKALNIDIFIPTNNKIEEKMKEFYSYISKNNFNAVIFSSLYYAPIGVLLYPLLEKICKIIGKIQFQQPEDYFDKKIDFVYTYIKKDNLCPNIFDVISSIDTEKIDLNLDIRTFAQIDQNKKIVISIGREIKYKNKVFWDFVIQLIQCIPDLCFVFFGCSYENLKEYVPEEFIKSKKIIFCGFNLNASAYLKGCDFYLNSYPGGGYSLQEAYYAELPIITFCEKEENNKKYNPLEVSSMITNHLYHDAENIFPGNGDFEALLSFSINLIENDSFRTKIQKSRKVNSQDLTFGCFVTKMENYIMNLIENKSK